jgi:phosphate:Na+ symporter
MAVGKGSFEPEKKDIRHLDPLLLRTPPIAIEQCKNELAYMVKLCSKNIARAFETFTSGNLKNVHEIEQIEDTIDSLQTTTTSFLVQISKLDLSDEVSAAIPELIHCINDAERIGDHAENLVELTELKLNNKIELSSNAMDDLASYFELISQQFNAVQEALDHQRPEDVKRALSLEEKLNEQHQTLAHENVSRVEGERCAVLAGIIFFDLLTNLEKVGDHLANIAERVTTAPDAS